MKRVILVLIFYLSTPSLLISQIYQEVSQQLGINVVYGWDPLTSGGVSFADFNMDGWDDLTFATSSGQEIHFYQNNQDGTFSQLPNLISHNGKARGILWADFDNDGDRDFFVAEQGNTNHFYENKGNLEMEKATSSVGLPLSVMDNTFGLSIGDYNNDGFLDLYVMNRVGPYTNFMFKNTGNETFVNDSFNSDIHDSLRLSFIASFFDLNMDGWQDFHIAQDKLYMRNSTYKNNGNGTFTDISDLSKSGIYIEAMSVAVCDYDNDGDQDFYVTNTNTRQGNVFLENKGNEAFENVAVEKGINMFTTSWGANFFDYDNDLDEDLYVCISDSFTKHNPLFENDGNGEFTDILVGSSGLPNDTVPNFAMAYGDFDNDGQIDIAAQSTTPFHARIWQNQVNNGNNWLKVRLEGTSSNRDGVGALLEMYINGKKYIRYVHCGDGFLAQNSFTKHFGMGTHTVADSLKIRWLGGNIDKLYNVNSNQTLYVIEGSTVSTRPKLTISKSFFIKKIYPNPLEFYSKMVISSKKTQTLEAIYMNSSGQVIFQNKIQLQEGENDILLPVKQFRNHHWIRCILTNEGERDEATLLQSR